MSALSMSYLTKALDLSLEFYLVASISLLIFFKALFWNFPIFYSSNTFPNFDPQPSNQPLNHSEPHVALLNSEESSLHAIQSKFELLDSAILSGKKNAATATLKNYSLQGLPQPIYSSNSRILTFLSCALYCIQCGLFWFLFSFSLTSSQPPLIYHALETTLFWSAISWSFLQFNSLYKVIKLHRYQQTLYLATEYGFYSVLWEIMVLFLSFTVELYRFYNNHLLQEYTFSHYLVLLNSFLLLIIIGSINPKPVQKQKSNPTDSPVFEGNIYTSNESLLEDPEQSSSFYGLMLFTWINDLMSLSAKIRIGYAQLYRMQYVDLPGYCWNRFAKVSNQHQKYSFFWKIIHVFRPEIILQICLIICLSFLKFSGPYFLNKILHFLENPDAKNDFSVGYIYCFGLAFFGFFQIILENQALWLGRKISIRLRNIITCELVNKSLLLAPLATINDNNIINVSDEKNDTISNKTSSSGMLMNLMTADLNKLVEVSAYIDYSVLAVTQLVFGIIYLYQLMGISSIAGLVIMVVYTRLSKFLFDYILNIQSQIYTISDKRLAAIGELVSGIKAVKLFGWESQFISKITIIRNEQLKKLWNVCKLAILNWFFLSLTPILVLASVFWIYTVVLGNKISAEIAFTSLTIFNIIRSAFENIPWIFSQLINTKVSFDRINKYLQQPEIQMLSDRCSNSQSYIGFEKATLTWLKQCDNPISNNKHTSQNDTTIDTPFLSQIERPLLESLSTDYNTISASDLLQTSFTLAELDIKFSIGQISVLSGPVGSGKSSILRALVGEMTLISGKIIMPTYNDNSRLANIAYVPQEPWLRNASVRDNILFGEEYNQEKYESVLFATALKPDMRALENGDMTLVGERGVSLSGGQKQRVALARALYSSALIVLIDDCLSAIDSYTANHIAQNCFVKKTFTAEKTIILASNHVHLSLTFADWVVLIRDGMIVTQGTPPDILICSDELEEERGSGKMGYRIWKTYIEALGSKYFWVIILLFAVFSEFVSIFHTYWVRLWVAAIKSQSLFLKSLPVITFTTIPSTLFSKSNWFIPKLYNDVVSTSLHTTPDDEGLTIYYLRIYLLIGLIMCALRQSVYYLFYMGSLRASKIIHNRLLQSVTHAKPSFFNKTPIGQIINRFSRDIQRIDDGMVDNIILWIFELLNAIAVIVIIALLVPPFLVVGLLMFSYFAFIASKYLNSTREMKRMESNTVSPLLSLFSELIPGITSIRAFGKQNDYIEETVKRMDNHNRPYYYLWASNRWLCINTDSAGLAVSFITAFFVIYNRDIIDSGLAGFTLGYSFTFSVSLMWVIRYISEIELGLNSVERISQYYENALPQEAPNIVLCNRPEVNWPLTGKLTVANLSVSYTGNNMVLKNLNFEISNGEKVAIVGRTGAGKSTLVHTLLRLAEPEDGAKIILDGIDILKIGLEDLRKKITIIPQDPILFSGTIRYNLDLFDEYTDKEIWNALHQAHLVANSDLTLENMNQERQDQETILLNDANINIRSDIQIKGTLNKNLNLDPLADDTPHSEYNSDYYTTQTTSPIESTSLTQDQKAEIPSNKINNMDTRENYKKTTKSKRHKKRYPFTSLNDTVREGGANLSLGQRQLVALSRALLRKSKLTIFDEATASIDFETDLKIQTTIRGSGFGGSTIIVIAHRLKTIMDFDKIILLEKGELIATGSPFELINNNIIFKTMCEMSNEYDTLYDIAKMQTEK
ncbi:hypothetical protein BB561_003737 [Smittium simulii]|uniref:Uncharacterized protein n=1 Tax=Smittium simulii TaxID=133385 RepID=A0A2T9YJU8_9FUNG|nr:hypothetical protein BB561_003737 [Smittium simulii]